MIDLRPIGACFLAVSLGGCLLLGWDFDKEPPVGAGGRGGNGGSGGGVITPADPVVLGQPDGEAQINLLGGLGGPASVALCGDKLVVTDSYNNRVLIYDPVPTPAETLREPTWVLGQPDVSSNGDDDGAESAATLDYPYAVACRGGDGPLAVADGGNNRVLVWNVLPGADQVPADVVVGQDDFEATEPNRGGGADARGIGFPGSVALGSNDRLAVADPDNHRVLLWDELPKQNGAAADHVVGQSSFSGSSSGVGADRLKLPHGIAFRQGAFWVSDFGNNRVLRWDSIPNADGVAADLVLGQPDFDSESANAGGEPGLDGFDGPGWLDFIDDTLFVTDWRNARALVWDQVPAMSSIPADRVLGQASGSATTPNTPTVTEGSLWVPWGLAVEDANQDEADRLYIVDEGNHRVTSFGRDVDNAGEWLALGIVAGQAGGGSNVAMAGGGIGMASLHGPVGAATDGQRLVVSDTWAHRLLLWNALPTDDEEPADVILGQATPDEAVGLFERATAERLYFPSGVALDDERLVVADRANHRVLIWDPVPSTSGAPATVVVGQANFSDSEPNRGGEASANTLGGPDGVDLVSTESGTKLLIADAGNDRVLIFDDVPNALDQPASRVLGQTTLSGSSGDIGPTKLNAPTDVVSDGQSIFVADLVNRRVMVWNEFPNSDGVAASFVIGQPDFETSDVGAVINDRTLHQPSGLALSDGYLFVADSSLHRILVFSIPITESFPAADFVLGQPDFSSSQQNDDGRSALTLASPRKLAAHGDLLVVPEFLNSRALMWRLGAVLD